MSASKEQEKINALLREQNALRKEAKQQLSDAGAVTAQQIKSFRDSNIDYKERLDRLKQINEELKEQKDTQKQLVNDYIAQESKLKGLTGLQSSLATLEHKRLNSMSNMKNLDGDRRKTFDSIASLQQDLLALSSEDVIARREIGRQLDAHYEDLKGVRGVHAHIRKNLLDQRSIAEGVSQMTEKQQEFLNKQLAVYDGIKDTIGGVFETLSLITKGPMGALGMGLIGAGFAADKLGKNIRSFGGFIDSAQFSALGLSFIFDDAEETAKSLSKEFGGLKDVTLSTQLNTNLMATNMGISGQEAASIVGSFARLNNGSADTAMNMAATTKEMAKAAGVPVDQVMKDVAGSTEAFAEYGKDGGINIAKAAVNAAQLGVSMDAMTKVTDSLLDFETSINSELELGAMLGRNINLDRARALAYEGNIGGAVKETIQSLGGIEAFNKMDIFSKREAAKLLGLSVSELEKMAANSDKINDDGTVQISTFDSITEAITAAATGSSGFLKTMGGLVLGAGQLGGSFAQMGFDVGGVVKSSAQVLKNLLGMVAGPVIGGIKAVGGGLANAFGGTKLSEGLGSIKDKLVEKGAGLKEKLMAGVGDKVAGGELPKVGADTAKIPQTSVSDKINETAGGEGGKGMNMANILKGAAAILILSAALYVAAKAFQEFGSVEWEAVAKGLVGIAGLAAIAYVLGKAEKGMIKGAVAVAILGVALVPFAFAMSLIAGLDIGSVIAAAAGLVIFAAAVFGLGALLTGPGAIIFGAGILGFLALGAALIVLGAGLQMVGAGFSAISSGLPMLVEQISALSTINFLPILGLAGALTVLSIALAAVAATGMLALPALLALGLIAGGAAAVMGGGEGEGGDRTGELIDEIKGLRADLIAGKIAVNIDGQKVTSNVGKVVSRISSNSYAKV
jgi:hypothetical protein